MSSVQTVAQTGEVRSLFHGQVLGTGIWTTRQACCQDSDGESYWK